MDGEHARAQNGGVDPAARLHDLQVLGGERIRARVDDLAHPGDQVFTGLSHRPANHDNREVDQVDTHGEHLTRVPPGLAHRPDRLEVALFHEVDHLLARGHQ